jgi:hypothetical protein
VANAMYTVAKIKMETSAFTWADGLWYAQFCNAGYAPNLLADTDITALTGFTIGPPFNLLSQVVSPISVMSAASYDMSGLTVGQTITSVVVYHDDGLGETYLGFFFDTGPGLPFTTTGSDVEVAWNSVVGVGPLCTL